MKTISKKIILLGHFGVGKTSLIQRFVHTRFSEQYLTTIGVKIDKKEVVIGETRLNMLIWDIAGTGDQLEAPKSYLLGSKGVIYVTDLSRPSTYVKLETELEKIQSLIPGISLITVANKKDLFSPEELAEKLKDYPFDPNFLASAKTGESVEELFKALAELIIHDL